MKLLELLNKESLARNLVDPDQGLDAAQVFSLVRDMPYQRASDRQPETTIKEWRGTCSGKHYLLHNLFGELGLPSKVVACTSITPVGSEVIPPEYQSLYEEAKRRFVDVHNYLLVSIPGGGEMIVDATWPLAARNHGMVVNKSFTLGQDQEIATEPIESWVIPPGIDPQAFKDELLREHFTPAELKFREFVISELSKETWGEQ